MICRHCGNGIGAVQRRGVLVRHSGRTENQPEIVAVLVDHIPYMPAVFDVDHQRNIQPVANGFDNRPMQVGANQRRHTANAQNGVLVRTYVIGGLGNLVEAEIEPLDLPIKLCGFGGWHQSGAHTFEQPHLNDLFEIADKTTDGRLGDVHGFGRGSNTTGHHHGSKRFDLPWFQSHLVSFHNIAAWLKYKMQFFFCQVKR